MSAPNVKQVVPFLMVASIERSLRYYVEGLGFARTNQWIVDGKIRWCWLELGGAALMLQESDRDVQAGKGMSLWFQCEDALALYDEFRSRGIETAEPFVGNSLWDVKLTDPDGYNLHFESPTDVPEETKLSEVRKG